MRLRTADAPLTPVRQRCAHLVAEVSEPIERVAFWVAVLTPIAYLLLLPVPGVTPFGVPALLTVIGIHALALLIGHYHHPGS